MKRKWLLFIPLLVVILVIIIVAAIVVPITFSYIKNSKIEQVVYKQYSGYEIVKTEYYYSDWSSTLREADNDHESTFAYVSVRNEEEKVEIQLHKNALGIWSIIDAKPAQGSDGYYAEISYCNVGNRIDIDEQIKNLWIIPDENGEPYSITGGEVWYYSYKECRKIYRIENNTIYLYNRETSKWDVINESFEDINDCNLQAVTEDFVSKYINIE